MTIVQIKNFLELAKTCNIRQTADDLYVSHQALSKQISSLEIEIGVKLFLRTNNRLCLTKAGEFLVDAWRPAIEKIETGIMNAQEVQRENKVLIGIPEMADILDAASSIHDLTNNYWEEEYVVDSVNNLIKLFQEKKLDVIVLFESDLAVIKKPYQYHVVKKLNYGVICNATHVLATKETVTISELSNETICFFDTNYVKSMEIDIYNQFSAFDLEPYRVRRYQNWNNLEMALRLGKGITMTYEVFLPRYVKCLSFVPIIEEKENPIHNLVVAWRDPELEELAMMISSVLE